MNVDSISYLFQDCNSVKQMVRNTIGSSYLKHSSKEHSTNYLLRFLSGPISFSLHILEKNEIMRIPTNMITEFSRDNFIDANASEYIFLYTTESQAKQHT